MWDVGEPSLTKGVMECLIVRRGDHRSPDKAIHSRAKRDVGEPKKPLLEERWHEVTEWWYLSPINKTAYIPYYINIQKERNDIYGI